MIPMSMVHQKFQESSCDCCASSVGPDLTSSCVHADLDLQWLPVPTSAHIIVSTNNI